MLRSDHGGLTAGPLTFHHPGRRGDPDHLDGITIGDVLLDVPDPLDATRPGPARASQARAGGRRAVLADGRGRRRGRAVGPRARLADRRPSGG